jgi:P-type conjugative transfer protein VirB9
MKRLAWILALFAVLGAHAAEVPQGSKFDNRIQYVDYNTGDVVVVRAVAGLGVRVVFSGDETILDVASGFTQGWEFSERRNILYIKPKSVVVGQGVPAMSPEAGKWDTNLMVTTNLRMYDIDLKLLPSNNSGNRVAYRVEYRYPSAEQAAAKALAQRQQAQAKLNAKPEPRNWNYTMQIGDASENIAPTMAYDDGRFTYLKFPNNRDFPSAFLVADDTTESLVNSHIDPSAPDTLVLQRVSKEIVLRLGNAVVGIYNDSFDPDGVPAEQGTTVPGVRRVIKAGEFNL